MDLINYYLFILYLMNICKYLMNGFIVVLNKQLNEYFRSNFQQYFIVIIETLYYLQMVLLNYDLFYHASEMKYKLPQLCPI
jgi:hypothetical protein